MTEEEVATAREKHTSYGRPGAEFVSAHDELCAWTLACTCGGSTGKLLGVRTDDVYTSPVCFACAACGKTVELFDAAVDGWNGEIARKQKRRKSRGASTFALRCSSCKGTAWHPAAVLTYQGDAETFAKAPPDRWQDFFDGMAIGGTCVRCEAVALPASFECA